MPSNQGEIYADIVLFGVRVAFNSDDQRALDLALTLYADWRNNAAPKDAETIRIALSSYSVNQKFADQHDVEGPHLAIRRKGIVVVGDGGAGTGSCIFPCDADSGDVTDLINTLVLFLVGHAGRVPLHASAVMLDGTAIVFSGASGAGKSTLALAASRAGLALLSDDTVFVQTSPVFRLWSLAGAIHVFAKDAPPDSDGAMRFRAGRWKRSLIAPERRHVAYEAVLCVLERGDAVSLTPLMAEDAVHSLIANPEPGYQFYGDASVAAARALAGKGAWRLTLSADPMEAIALILQHFAKRGGIFFHDRFVRLVHEIEHRFPVTAWKSGDADLWPLARFDMYLDMYWAGVSSSPPRPRALPMRVLGRVLKPLVNLWRSRKDLSHWRGWPARAPVVMLGDGVSLDRIKGGYQDRQGEALMTALERRGLATSLIQSGEVVRLPWRRPTFAANLVEAWGWLLSPLFAGKPALPGHAQMTAFLAHNGVRAPSLNAAALARRARRLHASAFLFEQLLRVIKPRLAFVVSYYAGLGPAFILACRRRRIASIDLQHAPLEGAPMAYRFSAYPATGYSTLPDLFWSWTQADAEAVRNSSHRSFCGGPPQWSLFDPGQDGLWDQAFAGNYDREMLVALQPIGGHRGDWEALVAVITTAPPNWRWWIRRHPASRPDQDVEFGPLLSLRAPNIKIEEASCLPLPILLRRMSAVLSLASGTAVEAATFGIPAFFLSREAEGPFGDLISSGRASVIAIDEIVDRIAHLTIRSTDATQVGVPDIDKALDELERLVGGHADAFSRNHVNLSAPHCAEKAEPV
jgi:hypothetical protein